MKPSGYLYATGEDAAAADLARGLAWIWRLGPLCEEPHAAAMGVGGIDSAAELAAGVEAGRLAGAVVLAGQPGPAVGDIPARRRVEGAARFDGGTAVEGGFTVFERGAAGDVRSSLGTHGMRLGRVLVLGFDAERDWGRLDGFWALEAIAAFLGKTLERPLDLLPPVGCIRLDDMPGTGAHQMLGRASSDRRQSRRIPRMVRRLESKRAVLSMAVVAQALDDGRRVPLDHVWPKSVRAIRAGIEAGAFEPVCHGLLHLDPGSLDEGEVEVREFMNLDRPEAGSHLDQALAWQAEHLGHPTSFCAPAWAYGPAADAEAAARGLVRWYRPAPGPLFHDGRLHESLIGELQGLHLLDYSPLARLAAIGIPPVFAMHGALLDGRLENLGGRLRSTGKRRRLPTLARLFFRRDMSRLLDLEGVRWVGTDELLAVLATRDGRGNGGTTG